jgi:phage/plasmid-like protein (TIGR03299 family)
MPANINSMAYAGEVPWHGLGTKLTKRMTSEEALEKGGLNWEVELQDVRAIDSEGNQIECEDNRAVVRKDNNTVLGVVGTSYVPLQNKEAFGFFDSAIKERKAIFETIGALGKGERVWMLAKVEGSDFSVLPNDAIEPYLLLSHSHDGTSCVRSKFTPIRVVCQNTLRVALAKSNDEIKIRHTGDVASKVRCAGDILRLAGAMIDETKPIFIAMAQKQLNATKTEEYVRKTFRAEIQQNKEASTRINNVVDEVMGLVETGIGSDIAGVRGSVWGAYNAVTEFIDHKRGVRGGESNRIGSIWFGQGSAVKQRAFSIGASLAGVKEVALLN